MAFYRVLGPKVAEHVGKTSNPAREARRGNLGTFGPKGSGKHWEDKQSGARSAPETFKVFGAQK